MKRLSKNILSLAMSDVLRRLFGFIMVAVLARRFGAETFGAINIGYSVLAYGLILSAGGLTTAGIRSVAQGSPSTIVQSIFSERLTSTFLLFSVIALLSLRFINDATTQLLVVLFALTMFPQALSGEWYYQGKEEMVLVGVARAIASLVPVVIAFFFIHSLEALWLLPVATVCGEFIATAIYLFSLKQNSIPLQVRPSYSLQLFRQSLPLTTGIVISSLVINYPPLALGIFSSTYETGIYSAASKLVFFLLIGDRLLGSLLLPAASRKVYRSPDELSSLVSDAFRWTLLLALPFTVCVMILAQPLLMFVFGTQYIDSLRVFRVFLWYFFITMLHTIATAVLITLNEEKRYSSFMVITAVLYFLFVSAGSYFFGALGAAVGVVCAEFCSLLLLYSRCRRIVEIHFSVPLAQLLFAIVISILVLMFTSTLWFGFQFVAGVITYFSILLITRAVRWYDIQTLLKKFL